MHRNISSRLSAPRRCLTMPFVIFYNLHVDVRDLKLALKIIHSHSSCRSLFAKYQTKSLDSICMRQYVSTYEGIELINNQV